VLLAGKGKKVRSDIQVLGELGSRWKLRGKNQAGRRLEQKKKQGKAIGGKGDPIESKFLQFPRGPSQGKGEASEMTGRGGKGELNQGEGKRKRRRGGGHRNFKEKGVRTASKGFKK